MLLTLTAQGCIACFERQFLQNNRCDQIERLTVRIMSLKVNSPCLSFHDVVAATHSAFFLCSSSATKVMSEYSDMNSEVVL